MYDMYVWNVCMKCMYEMYVWNVCMTCMYEKCAWHICMTCVYWMYVWNVCMTSMGWHLGWRILPLKCNTTKYVCLLACERFSHVSLCAQAGSFSEKFLHIFMVDGRVSIRTERIAYVHKCVCVCALVRGDKSISHEYVFICMCVCVCDMHACIYECGYACQSFLREFAENGHTCILTRRLPVCMYVCMHASMYVCMHVCTWEFFPWVCRESAYMHMLSYNSWYVDCPYVCMYVCMYIGMHARIHVRNFCLSSS
jgi:hypothetical protein